MIAALFCLKAPLHAHDQTLSKGLFKRLKTLCSRTLKELRADSSEGIERLDPNLDFSSIRSSDLEVGGLEDGSKIYLRSISDSKYGPSYILFIEGNPPGEGFVRFSLLAEPRSLEIEYWEGIKQKPGSGTKLLKKLLEAFPDYHLHARLELTNRRRFQEVFIEVVHNSPLNSVNFPPTKIEKVPLLNLISVLGRNFHMEILMHSEIHVFSQAVADPIQGDVEFRLMQMPKREMGENIGVWTNERQFYDDYFLGRHRLWILNNPTVEWRSNSHIFSD